jgi:N-methylhydantoinase B
VLAEDAELTMRSDRRKHPPYGLFRWQAREPLLEHHQSRTRTADRHAVPDATHPPEAGRRVRPYWRGGGGYGSPLERDPERVLQDVIEEKESIEFARRAYGVVIDTASMTIDDRATESLRRARSS